jgi:carbamoyl-phosphate synthase (ammonia)
VDSIVLAPSQTLSNREYHMLRETAIKVVRHLNIVGECNIQFALDPMSMDYCIIEVNPRMSRSSALASKATGYPLASVAAKLSLGITLPEIRNAVTGCTQACFEPSLDYVVTKVPRWDLGKFERASQKVGTSMKSVGEVMAIGRTWEESLQKALRMVNPNTKGFQAAADKDNVPLTKAQIVEELQSPTDKRVFAIAQALENDDLTFQEIMAESSIDPWFLGRLKNIADYRKFLRGKDISEIDHSILLQAKQYGFSDLQIAALVTNTGEVVTDDEIRNLRLSQGVTPWAKQIDTLAAEYPAQTNYLYMTYHGREDDIIIEGGNKSHIVLGSGCYCIGSSVEFDWCAVSVIRTLRQMGFKSTMINFNPETVSTDYDECDQLYFDELSKERVMDIYEKEKSEGVVVSTGGQISNTLALPLHAAGINVLGTCPTQIDRAEDREKFSSIIDALGIQQAGWAGVSDNVSALQFAERVGFPVLVRPSYVLSGAAMNVAYTPEQLLASLQAATGLSSDFPVVISKFIKDGREIEMDGIAKNGVVVGCAMYEHIENAGVHSGDAHLMLPTHNVSEFTKIAVEENTQKIVHELNITGPFNIQFIAKGSDLLCIECNLRASRSFPFVSKTMGVDFIEAATKLIMNGDVSDMDLPGIGTRNRPAGFVGVKAPMFSYSRLEGADPVLGVEMASTGEVACFGESVHEAYLKALLSTGFKIPTKSIAVTIQKEFLEDVLHHVHLLHIHGYRLLATAETQPFLEAKGIPCTLAPYAASRTGAGGPTSIRDSIAGHEVDLVINIGTSATADADANNNYVSRRSAVDFNVPLMTDPQLFKMFAEALDKHKRGEITIIKPDSLSDYYAKE